MYIQIINQTLPSSNQITIEVCDDKIAYQTYIAIKQRGWKLIDCVTKQINGELVTRKYGGVDGKTVPAGTRQYKSRAKSMGTLNINRKKELLEI